MMVSDHVGSIDGPTTINDGLAKDGPSNRLELPGKFDRPQVLANRLFKVFRKLCTYHFLQLIQVMPSNNYDFI